MFATKAINPYFYRHQPANYPIFPLMHNQIQTLNAEEDLASISLQIDKKRFYIDLKRNNKGKFIKIAEIGVDGRKVRIIMTMPAALELKNKLKDLIDKLKELQSTDGSEASSDSGNHNGDKSESGSDGLIKSHALVFQKRRYFLDLKHNKRGYFVRLTMLTSFIRVQLAIPQEGLDQFYEAICQLFDKWYDPRSQENAQTQELPESKSLKIRNKSLHFDTFSNQSGLYLRISELRMNNRNSLVLPLECIDQFQEIVSDMKKKLYDKQPLAPQS